MALFGTGPEKTQAKLDSLVAARRRLESEIEQDSLLLQTLIGEQGGRELQSVLDDSVDPSVDRENIRVLKQKIEARQTAMPLLLDEIRQAIINSGTARADVIRAQIAKLKAEHTKHLAEVDKRLKALEELAGVTYVMKDAVVQLAMPGMIYPARKPELSIATKQAIEIRDLEAQADRIEAEAARQAKGGSVVNAESLEALLAGVAAHPLAPSPVQIRAWFGRVTTGADQQWAREQATWWPAVDRVTRYNLAWSGSAQLSEAQSSATNSHISRPAFNETAHPPLPQPPRNWYPAA